VSHRNLEITDREQLLMLLRSDPDLGLEASFQRGAAEMAPTYPCR
jgi:hypothetical protein